MMQRPTATEHPGSVLVVEDDPSVLQFLLLTLEVAGHTTFGAEDGEQAVRVAAGTSFDLVLLDQGLPGMQGAMVLSKLREMTHLQHTRFLVVSGSIQSDALVALLRAGAHDFIRKPCDPAELHARIDTCLRTKRELDALVAAALHDQVTGLLNRRGGEQQLARLHAHSRRHGEPLAVLMVDVNDFKVISDQHGHDVGDDALRHAAARLSAAMRPGDALCRWGGDEFLAILPATALLAARMVAERCTRLLSVEPMSLTPAGRLEVAITVGAAASTLSNSSLAGQDLASLVRRADADLYRQRRRPATWARSAGVGSTTAPSSTPDLPLT